MTESATDFLNEFVAHLVLMNIDSLLPKPSAGFQLQRTSINMVHDTPQHR